MRISRCVLLVLTVFAPLAGSAQILSNLPPSVAIVMPTNGARFQAPADLDLWANATDRDGHVVEVSFFANQRYIGGVTNPPPTASLLPPWRILWQGVAPGRYSLQARATDDRGARGWSSPVGIEVAGTNQPPGLPVVNVTANDPDASEGSLLSWPTSGSFRFMRSGSTTDPLTVHFAIGGTASNGVDYRKLTESVTFAAGNSVADLHVGPLDDNQVEPTETVIVRIEPPLCAAVMPPPPGCYAVGSNHTATVFIRDGIIETNRPPIVRIISPANDSKFPDGTPIRICADAFDHSRYLDTVEFFAGDRSLGIVTNNPFSLAPYVPFCVVWSNAPAGDHVLTARATDDSGLMATSAPVHITVGGTNRPPPPPDNIVLTIEAVDPTATEQDPRLDALSDGALMLVRRHGPTNIALLVQYRVGGSASNGVDYSRLAGTVEMPSGATTAEIAIDAIDDAQVEGIETVVVQIIPPVCITIVPPPPECYQVGRPDTAVAYIRDNDSAPSNSPPGVRITAPANGARFPAGTDIRVDAVTVDRDGYAPMVEFFANGRKIGEEVIQFIQAPPDGTPIEFSFLWPNVPAGSYTLTARATDDDGVMALSAPIGIRVGTNELPPPPTNVVVSIAAVDAYAVEGPLTNSTVRGTNIAAFLVRRAGPTNDPVTVRYRIGGTASNGLDYVSLSGEVAIAAGARGARILILPLEDRLAEGVESVVVELARAENDPPSYLVGRESRAAAVIADNDSPRPRCQRLPGGLFHICLPGTDGNGFRLEASTDLANWSALCTSVVTDGAIHFVDPDVEALPYRFYRAVPDAVPLQE